MARAHSAARGQRLASASMLLACAVAVLGSASSGRPHAKYSTCRECVDAGFGWSVKKQRCGGFANKECQEAPATGATEVCKDQIPIDEEAEAYEAERADVDRANMIDAVRIAKELASRDGDLNADSLGRHNRCDLKKENKAMALRCPGHNVIEAIDFASYGTPSGQCVDNSGEHNFQIDSECHAPGSQEFVERKCMGKNWCEVAATNQDFSDPCYGKGKMLAVVVRCSTGRTQPDLPAGIDPDPAKRPSLPPLPRVTMRQLQKRPDLLKG